MHLFFRATNTEIVSEREYSVNFDMVQNTVYEVYEWQELDSLEGSWDLLGQEALRAVVALYTRPLQAVKIENFAKLRNLQLPRTETMGDCGARFNFIL